MVTYLFYTHAADGAATMFVAHDLRSDTEAMVRAKLVLAEHASAVEVAIWREDRLVGRVADPALRPVRTLSAL